MNPEHLITSERNQELIKLPLSLPLSPALSNHLSAVCLWACLFCVFQGIELHNCGHFWLASHTYCHAFEVHPCFSRGWFLSFA